MTAVEFGVAACVVAVGAAIQGSLGFGMNLLAAPVLALVAPELLPGPAIAAAVLLTVLVARRDRAGIDRRGVAFALVGRVPGTVLGALLVSVVSPRALAVLVAVGVLLAVVLTLVRARFQPTAPSLLVAGAVSGFASTVSSIGGPPLAIVYAGQPGPVMRGSMSAVFVVGGAMSLAALAAFGDFGRADAAASLLLLLPGVVGFAGSRRLLPYVDAGRTRALVLAVSSAGALGVLAKAAL